jgi:hypothetical protein
MTAPEIAAAMSARGVRFGVVGNRLRVDAPAGELTETDWTTLAANKPALLALLTSAQEPNGAPAELDPVLAVAIEIFGGRVVADGQPAVWPPKGGYIPTSSGPSAPALMTQQQLVEKLWMALKALRWQALAGLGSYPVGGSRDAWEDFIQTAERPRLDRALDAATRTLADLNGHPTGEPGGMG